MAATRKMKLKITVDASGAARAFRDLGDRASSFGSKMVSWNQAAELLGKVASAARTAAGAVWELANSASDLNEAQNKSMQVFGRYADTIENWSKSAATSIGMSRTEAIDAASSFGQLFKHITDDKGEIADMSMKMTNLASDIASFNNISVESAKTKLLAGMVGEAEPLRRVGVFVNAAATEAQMLAMGMEKVNGAWTDGQKMAARYALVLEQTGIQQGDFGRTSGLLANQQRILRAQWENMKITLGEGLLPAITSIMTALNASMPTLIEWGTVLSEKVGGAISSVTDKMLGTEDGSGPLGLNAVQEQSQSKWQMISETFTGAMGWIQTNLGEAWPKLVALFEAGLGAIGAFIELWVTLATTLWNNGLKEFAEMAASVFTSILDIIKGVLHLIEGVFHLFTAVLKGDWSAAGEALVEITKALWEIIKAVFVTGWKLVVGFVKTAWAMITGIFEAGWTVVSGLVRKLWSFITGAFEKGAMAVLRFAQGLWQGVRDKFNSMAVAVTAKVVEIWTTVQEKFSSGATRVLTFLSGLPGRIANAFGDAGRILWDVGSKIMNGMWDGLKAGWEKVKSWLGQVTDWIPDWKGPPEKDKKLLVPTGKMIMSGFEKGLEDGWRRTVIPTLSSFTGGIAPAVNANLVGTSGAQMITPISPMNGAPTTIIINQTISNPDPAATAEAVKTAIRRYGPTVIKP